MEEGGESKVTTSDELVRDMLSEDGNDLPQAEVDRRAKGAIEAEMGGCSELLKVYQDFQERYRNPPKWPPQADQ
ncbi:hypothetical protein GCM10007880_39510 [Mesorhizobium amorphae]|uniref:Uncharacterized protein n=1 Tax=Mesorhizobium amorphae CCNWGS0123 TaxID=1082933 RepID=G6YKQ7_9HYPH|nr:hypothetical protein A6B35_02345 [Mesorhizobium amorphae CCNWGS0123]EHH03513.1 hypothetical protein MEA186_32962 [Mesorhizobium amorphae CCNWGS0123]GLR43434.1 hypothetical protein GCM10007880_39510 [Mesorhizobium amorphae]